tara:strand:+ start:112 stop:294 length:183 start_codon:yes stop_codon:yes gene_type:complete
MKTLINKLRSLKAKARNCWDINELDAINAEIVKTENEIKKAKAVRAHYKSMVKKIMKANQ